MYYKDYETYRDNAWNIHLTYKTDRLPVDIRKLCRDAGISVYSYGAAQEVVRKLMPDCRTDGFSVIICGRKCIFYDQTKPAGRQNFTIAHEMGHYANGDVGCMPTEWNREPTERDKRIEKRANMVAARILAPACILWALKVNDALSIARICDISLHSAEWRLRRLRLLYARETEFYLQKGNSCFFQSPLELQVLKQFEPFIREYWKNLSSQA